MFCQLLPYSFFHFGYFSSAIYVRLLVVKPPQQWQFFASADFLKIRLTHLTCKKERHEKLSLYQLLMQLVLDVKIGE
jgi:hypothetical protein